MKLSKEDIKEEKADKQKSKEAESVKTRREMMMQMLKMNIRQHH